MGRSPKPHYVDEIIKQYEGQSDEFIRWEQKLLGGSWILEIPIRELIPGRTRTQRDGPQAILGIMVPATQGPFVHEMNIGSKENDSAEILQINQIGLPLRAGKNKDISLPLETRELASLYEHADSFVESFSREKEIESGPSHGMIGNSDEIKALKRQIGELGPSEAHVLIFGESGTGKELVAKALHLSGPRAEKPYVICDCPAIPDTLLESELFGTEALRITGVGQGDGLVKTAES